MPKDFAEGTGGAYLVDYELKHMPKKPEGKKRIVIAGDSMATDDLKWGWAPHMAYDLVEKKMPFEVLNFARGGAYIDKNLAYVPGSKSMNV